MKAIAQGQCRMDSGLNTKLLPEFVQGLRDVGHLAGVKLKPMSEMNEQVADLFNFRGHYEA